MTLAETARIRIDPSELLHKKEVHDLAHLFVSARKKAAVGQGSRNARRARRRHL